MHQLLNRIFAFPIEDSANSLHVIGNNLLYRYESEKMPLSLIGDIDLPPGQWQILFLTREATDSDWRKVVETVDYDVLPSPGNDFQGDWRTGYRDYESNEETGCSEFPFVRTPTLSGHSLLKSKGLHDKGNYVLICKI